MSALRTIVLTLALVAVTVVSSAQEPVVTVFYYERMPFFGVPGTEREGVVLTIARLALERAGIPFVFEKVPVNRLFSSAAIPGPFCVPGAFRTPDRERVYRYSALPLYRDEPPHFVVRAADAPAFSGVTDVESLLSRDESLGVVQSYSYGSWVDAAVARYDPRRVVVTIGDNQDTFYRMLLYGRFDYFFASPEEASSIIGSRPEFEGEFAVLPLSDAPEGNQRWMMFSPGFPRDLRERFDAALAALRADAAYATLIDDLKRSIYR